MDKVKICVLDENKECDDCGECNRCDLDPNKICDNCCMCIAMEDEGNEFRSRVLKRDGTSGTLDQANAPKLAPRKKTVQSRPVEKTEYEPVDLTDEPEELTPELVAYWERILIEHGEAPADDGFGEIEVDTRVPVYGSRKRTDHRKKHE